MHSRNMQALPFKEHEHSHNSSLFVDHHLAMNPQEKQEEFLQKMIENYLKNDGKKIRRRKKSTKSSQWQ